MRLHCRRIRLGEVRRLEDRRDRLEEGSLDLGVYLLEEDSHLAVGLEGVRPVKEQVSTYPRSRCVWKARTNISAVLLLLSILRLLVR
jgi:hypothetical protein